MNQDAAHLSRLLRVAAAQRPDHAAVEDEAGRSLCYRELDHAADRLATRLARWGIGRGDRLGLLLPKSIESVAAIHGALRSGAAYVPIDSTAPLRRGVGILADARVRAVIIAAEFATAFRAEWPDDVTPPRLISVGSTDDHDPQCATWDDVMADGAPTALPPHRDPDDLAYVLYTSGSTGTPKGVMLSHRNACCFLDWCEGAFELRPDDRFASHAPFHFDLSIFDLYASCRRQATLVLIGESLGKDPVRLATWLVNRHIDVWYSAPSILALLAQYGAIDRPDFRAPRLVLFAGEVFPIGHLKRLRAHWPNATMWNLYGPTETNVCTAQRLPAVIPDDCATPFPIGRVCPPLWARVVDEEGRDLSAGARGELLIAGPGVMRGYFGQPTLTRQAFLTGDDGRLWYRTGDLVEDDGTGCYHFHGRRDRMVKKRGYRIELGEIEAALARHDDVATAAVVARANESEVSIAAFVALKPARKVSIIAMKKHCTIHLPNYMIPDQIAIVPALPTTSTAKVDYQELSHMLALRESTSDS